MLGYAGAYHRTHHALLHPRPTGCGPQGLVFERSAIPMLAPLLESFPQPRDRWVPTIAPDLQLSFLLLLICE